MLVLLCVVLAAALGWVLWRHFALKRQLRAWAAEIEALSTQATATGLRLDTGDADAAALARAVNALHEGRWAERAAHAEAMQAVRRGMADISHDLRTPLTSIKGYLGLLAKPGNTPAQQAEYLQTAQDKAESMGRLVEMLFLHARLEAGDYPLELAAVELNTALAEALSESYTGFAAAGLQPQVVLYGQPLAILADAAALSRVFSNLLGNCLRHGAGEVSVKSWRQEGRAVVEVANLAPSLEEADVAHLFERSFVADRARTGEKSGLGLAIASQLVRQMGGVIDARLEKGRLVLTLIWPLCK